jgi:hypothetical protein
MVKDLYKLASQHKAHLLELSMRDSITVHHNGLGFHAIVAVPKQNEESLDVVFHVRHDLLSVLQSLDAACVLREGTAHTTAWLGDPTWVISKLSRNVRGRGESVLESNERVQCSRALGL